MNMDITNITTPKKSCNHDGIMVKVTSLDNGSISTTQVSSHKFLAPQSYADAVIRHDLLKKIFRDPPYSVVVIQAPAGHGKSTLLQQIRTISENHKILTGWLNFDEADNDLHRFTLHIQTLIHTLLSQTINPYISQTHDSQKYLSDWIVNRLTQVATTVHLFFDELQHLTNPDVLKVFRELLERLPHHVSIFISSRTIPDIGLARLVVSHRAMILHGEHLCFAPQEVELFFSQYHDLKISPEELNTIYQQTEGWPAALQLFRLSLVNPAIRQSLDNLWSYRPRKLAEYLADNVLSLQSPDIQDFLCLTSVLTRLSAPLCDHITGQNNSQSILLFLERSGLFLRSLDPHLSWFKYHTLFSSFLSEQLRNESAELSNLVHHRAAEWFYQHTMDEDALHHAIAAQDYDFATQIMNRWCDQLITDGFLTTVERWADALPLNEIVKNSELAIKISWAFSFLRRHHKLNTILTTLEQQSDNSSDTRVIRLMQALSLDDIPQVFEIAKSLDLEPSSQNNKKNLQGFYAFELAAVANVNMYQALCCGNFEHAQHSFNIAQTFNIQSGAEFSSGYTTALLGMTFFMQGRLENALSRYRIGLTEQHHSRNKSVAAAVIASCYTQALYEHNDLDAAEAIFTQHRDMISSTALLDFLAAGYIAMARTYHARGQLNHSEEILKQAEELAHTSGWSRLNRIILWERIRCTLMLGDIERAKSLSHRIPSQPDFDLPGNAMIYSEVLEGDAISAIRLALHSGDIGWAAAKLATELDQAQQQNSVFRTIKLSILEALIQQRQGATHLAQQALEFALQKAAPEGCIRVFLDEGQPLLALLRDEQTTKQQKSPKLQQFISQLLEIADQPIESIVQPLDENSFQPIEPLTDREKDILIYLANGVSNKEIARRIFVSENTVKFHLKNIYAKLAVNSRLQAINAARQMKLVN
ncbi:LuxR C-terminal-related transcriptional regulator [Acinetobacter baumannii]|uniref:LuxR C-terminal-related transcriptional regulator n=1 Tax=Acinetobacter baumannii TaxID=470 RepID=UPI003AF6FD9B